MKNSYFQTPRTMNDGTWAAWADPIEHYPPSFMERVVDVVLALAIGIGLAAALVAWWSA